MVEERSENDPLVGKRLTGIRPMTKKELNEMDWEVSRRSTPLVLIFEDGYKMFPSRDAEGNEPGVLFVVDNDDKMFTLLGTST
jgi:hypothetical protein